MVTGSNCANSSRRRRKNQSGYPPTCKDMYKGATNKIVYLLEEKASSPGRECGQLNLPWTCNSATV